MHADSPAAPDHAVYPRDAAERDRVAAYLRANPTFLAEHPQLFQVLIPPARVHGEGLADHMTAMVGAARARAVEMTAKAEIVLAAGRAAAGIAERVQEAVMAALQAADPMDCVAEIWPGLLGVDAAALACEGFLPRWRRLPLGLVGSLLGDRPMVMRDHPGDAAMLHAEAAPLARRDVLVRVPAGRPALLALASRDASALPATQAWSFLGRVLGALLFSHE